MNNDWRLEKLTIEFESFGKDKGKYTGKIKFQNGEYESFSFRIKPDMAKPYIDLISGDIVNGADTLIKDLIESLGINEVNK